MCKLLTGSFEKKRAQLERETSLYDVGPSGQAQPPTVKQCTIMHLYYLKFGLQPVA